MSSNEWRKTRLGDIATIIDCPHSTPKWTDSGYFVIRNWNIRNGRLVSDRTSYTDEKTFLDRIRRGKPEFGDLVLTREAPMGEVCMIPQNVECCLGQRVVLIKPNKEEIDPEFLLYSIQSPCVQNQINLHDGTGSTVSNLRIPAIHDLNIPLPPLPIQKRIAGILSALDEKIELNRQMNATLEAIAQAIFREWFVRFNYPGATGELVESELGLIPAGWRVGKLGEFCNNKRQTVHPNDITPETAYVGLEHVPRRALSLNSWGTADDVGSQKTQFQKWDILFGKLRPYFHKVCIAPVDGICSTDILVIEPIVPELFAFCLNYLFSDDVIAYVSVIADGTRMPRVNWQSISDYQIVIPPDFLLSQFNNVVKPLYEKMLESSQQSTTLAQIRDTLLPKLIRGEVAV